MAAKRETYALREYSGSSERAARDTVRSWRIWLCAAAALLLSGILGFYSQLTSLENCARFSAYSAQKKERKGGRSKYVELEISGRLSSDPRFSRDRLSFQADVLIDGQFEAPLQILCPHTPWQTAPWMRRGDNFSAVVKVRAGQPFEAALSHRTCGYAFAKRLSQPVAAPANRTEWSELLSGLYRRFGGRDALDAVLAMFFAERGVVSERLKTVFADLGMTHALVVSGFHIGVIYSVFAAVVRAVVWLFPQIALFAARQSLSAVFGAIGVTLYAAFIGWGPTAARAAVAAYYISAARFFSRRAFGARSIAIALISVCFLWPGAPLSLGVQLTFSALVGIWVALTAAANIEITTGAVRFLVSNLFCCIGAWLFTAPVLMLWFSELSAWGVVANFVFLTPLCGLVLTICGPLLALIVLAVNCAWPEALVRLLCAVCSLVLLMVDCVLNAMTRFADFTGPLIKFDRLEAMLATAFCLAVSGVLLTAAIQSARFRRLKGELELQSAEMAG